MNWRFIFRGLKAKYRDQRLELASLIDNIPSNAIAIDVGANKGSYLLALSKALPDGLVYAFEPQPYLARYLKKSCSESNLKNIKVIQSGCSFKSGFLNLAIPKGAISSPSASFEKVVFKNLKCRMIRVNTITLDDFFFKEKRKIKALKIDVEGHELSVLKGAVKIIKKHKPVIVCESEQRHLKSHSVHDVINFILSLGYKGFYSNGKRLVSLESFNLDLNQRQGIGRYWDSKNYYNNFIFKPI